MPERRTPTGTRRPAGGARSSQPHRASTGHRSVPGARTTHTSSRPRPAGRPASTRPMAVAKRTYRPVRRIPLAPSGRRLRWAVVAMVLALVVCAARLVQLQGFDTEAYAARADDQSLRLRTLPAQRGLITDRNGQVLASTEPAVNIVCDPVTIRGTERDTERYRRTANERLMTLAGLLARHLGGSPFDYLGPLTRPDTRYSYIRKQVPAGVYRALADDLWQGGLGGIARENNPVRSYPAGTMAGNLVGFVNGEGVGSAGLEAWFDHQLAGTDGKEAYEISQYGRIPLGANVQTPPVDGFNLQTTIDGDLQTTVEVAVQRAVQASGAESGFGIVMNVKNGEILALAANPGYDPGRYGEYDQSTLTLRAVGDAYEPGSVMKVLTLAAAADLGIITPETQLNTPPKLMSGGDAITDLHEHDPHLNARGVLVESSNIGTTMIGRKLTREQFFDYLNRFGLGNRTGVQLPGEGTGSVNYDMTEAQRDRAVFGQSVSVTGVQMAAALAAVANGGVYNPPTIVRSVTDATGRQVSTGDDRQARRVISAEAAAMTINMMENVVTDKNYELLPVEGYRTFGKTGTAERYEPSCGCYRGNTVSYVGIGSAEDPSLLVYLVIDKPTKGEPSGYYQAGPAVADILKVALPRYGVPVSTTPPRKEPKTW